MKDVMTKHVYISFYNEYLYDTDPKVIEMKKELAKQNKQNLNNIQTMK
jgi:hypothetical protein